MVSLVIGASDISFASVTFMTVGDKRIEPKARTNDNVKLNSR
jgi:hypothetical protein